MSEMRIRRVIFPKRLPTLNSTVRPIRRVAAYARVSTSADDQLNSLEAQKDFYSSFIMNHSDWKFCGLFADSGISGLSRRHRPAFNEMIECANRGELDLIITKSISRFARNTVDALLSLRKLKSVGCEVYFEKEDIWTFDAKGEFMLTLLSCMAQEESRSISENITWGQRKRIADGRYSVPYKCFLGYDRGMVINKEQANLVRKIYKLYLTGYTEFAISHQLEILNALSPRSKPQWSKTTLRSILQNEKYKGDALLQKTFTTDFLTKTHKTNEGELPQYYVTDGHESIIPRRTFDYAQEVRRERNVFGKNYSCKQPFSSRIVCPVCGGYFGSSSSHFHDRYWSCVNQRIDKQSHFHYIPDRSLWDSCSKAISTMIIRHTAAIKNIFFTTNLNDDDLAACMRYIRHLPTLQLPGDELRILITCITPVNKSTFTIHFLNGEILNSSC